MLSLLRVFTTNATLDCKYAKYERFFYFIMSQCVTVSFQLLCLRMQVLIGQKHCFKQVRCMLLASNCMLIAPQKDTFVGIISCQLWQKVIVQKTKWSCLPPVCLSFFSRLKVFMSRFLGVKIQKKPNNFCQTHYIGGVGMWGVIVAQPPWVKEDV